MNSLLENNGGETGEGRNWLDKEDLKQKGRLVSVSSPEVSK